MPLTGIARGLEDRSVYGDTSTPSKHTGLFRTPNSVELGQAATHTCTEGKRSAQAVLLWYSARVQIPKNPYCWWGFGMKLMI